MANEEAKMMLENENNGEVLTAFSRIPYSLINAEVKGSTKEILDEFTQICRFYKIFKKGAKFSPEGAKGDYIPATLRYKMAASLIKKEARFLFAEAPDIMVEAKGDVGKVTEESKKALTVLNDLITTTCAHNNFEEILLKAAKDCFIGKRVAGLVNFNEEDGITLTFLKSTQFVYETKFGNPNVLTKFVCFIVVDDSLSSKDRKIFKKKFEVDADDGQVYLEESLHDGSGALIEEITPRQPILLSTIPAVVIVNDGLLGEAMGESEVELLEDFERWYSKLSNADMDAERKSMNPVRYTVDMDNKSTKGLSSSAGSFWDLLSDQNLAEAHPQVGTLESSMNYSESLKTSLDRLKTVAYEQVDMPNITLESMQGSITTGKALKAIYWTLIVRCKEKMKTWGPQLRSLFDIVIKGAMVYPDCAKMFTNDVISPVDYEIKIVQNTPLPEDEIEEKNADLSEVDSQVMSKKAYMKKWRGLTDAEADEELKQIAYERQILEDFSFGGSADIDDSEEDDANDELVIKD
ncbi:MAG: phage portal protein [Clostridia bacterium]|nr:phage portal protein [Clostridia bacterium]